ncbi:MAG: tetratricopeptide repeat protein [Myxococcaceae bacterium]|nr:tetratricopeptide repeat protein [Myxococcaceae bacterium]
MRRVLPWMAVVALCCAISAKAGEEPPDARLQEAQRAYDEASALEKAGKQAEALARGEHALALWEAVLGGAHPEVARCLELLGNLHKHQRKLDRAEALIQRGLAIREAALGKDHPDVAQSLNTLANIYSDRGWFDRARPLYERALALREAALGEDHPDVAQSLNPLAILHFYQGSLSQAEALFARALAIREAALGEDHPDVATSLNSLGLLYDEMGQYDRAEPLLERALAIREAALGKNHYDVANSLNNLASLYMAQGMYGRAQPLFERALTLREAAMGKNHPAISGLLNNLASVYKEQGQYRRAEQYHKRALAIREAALGKDHLLVSQSLHNLAIIYKVQGKFDRAEPLLRRALAIREAVHGKEHPRVSDSLNNLANVYLSQEMYARAEPLYERALAIVEAAYGQNHPDVANSLNNLARLRLEQHRLDAALPLLTRAFAMSEQRLRQEALGLSEERLASLLQLLHENEEPLFLALRENPGSPQLRQLVLSAALLLKGRSVEEMADISRAIYRSLGPEERDTFERLRALRTRLAELSLQGPGALPPAAYQQQLQELTAQGDALEATLARRSAPLRALSALPAPADIVARVAQALPEGSALVEFITYLDRRPLPPHKAQLRYLALVLFPDATTRALDLGPAEPLDAAASRLRAALANRDASSQAHARALYKRAFQPLLPLLGKTRRLFLSPDGQLSQVPFAALHDGRQFLVDAFDFTYLTSGKDLLPRPQEAAPAASVVVLADPDFNARLQPPARAERSASMERFFSTLREGSARRSWSVVSLPGTRQEAEAIQRLLPQAQLFLGPEATKERLLHLPTPGILHVATHGIFLGDASTPAGSRAIGHFGALGQDTPGARAPDPLLRSGLLLAGANASPPGAPSQLPESVLVTALELAGLDLWGTQLVVLSACDTGRGDVKLGQGIYGLRRALVVAGAETVVMSLWKVNDDSTQRLMEAYYRNLLAGQGRATALREAMRWLRASRPEPHHWAPFIVVGRDAPLRALAAPPQAPPAP